jgi:hypothetical protein
VIEARRLGNEKSWELELRDNVGIARDPKPSEAQQRRKVPAHPSLELIYSISLPPIAD